MGAATVLALLYSEEAALRHRPMQCVAARVALRGDNKNRLLEGFPSRSRISYFSSVLDPLGIRKPPARTVPRNAGWRAGKASVPRQPPLDHSETVSTRSHSAVPPL